MNLMKQSNDINWEEIAKSLLMSIEAAKLYNYPEPTTVLITWKDRTYIGSVQDAAPKFSKEIVVLSKSSNPLSDNLVNAIKKLDQNILKLHADNLLDLDGRQHILRRLESKLTYMTKEQTAYMMEHPIIIHEIKQS